MDKYEKLNKTLQEHSLGMARGMAPLEKAEPESHFHMEIPVDAKGRDRDADDQDGLDAVKTFLRGDGSHIGRLKFSTAASPKRNDEANYNHTIRISGPKESVDHVRAATERHWGSGKAGYIVDGPAEKAEPAAHGPVPAEFQSRGFTAPAAKSEPESRYEQLNKASNLNRHRGDTMDKYEKLNKTLQEHSLGMARGMAPLEKAGKSWGIPADKAAKMADMDPKQHLKALVDHIGKGGKSKPSDIDSFVGHSQAAQHHRNIAADAEPNTIESGGHHSMVGHHEARANEIGERLFGGSTGGDVTGVLRMRLAESSLPPGKRFDDKVQAGIPSKGKPGTPHPYDKKLARD